MGVTFLQRRRSTVGQYSTDLQSSKQATQCQVDNQGGNKRCKSAAFCALNKL